MTDFEPQFHPRLIPGLAARYEYEDDEEVITIGAAASQRGYYTLEEFRPEQLAGDRRRTDADSPQRGEY